MYNLFKFAHLTRVTNRSSTWVVFHCPVGRTTGNILYEHDRCVNGSSPKVCRITSCMFYPSVVLANDSTFLEIVAPHNPIRIKYKCCPSIASSWARIVPHSRFYVMSLVTIMRMYETRARLRLSSTPNGETNAHRDLNEYIFTFSPMAVAF